MSSGIQRLLATAIAAGAALTLTPAATAAPATTSAKLRVEVEITNKAKYTASVCGLDWLGGYCLEAKPGQTKDFTVYPRTADDPIEIRVVVRKGGSEYYDTPTGGKKSCFETGGTAKRPTVTQVDCA